MSVVILDPVTTCLRQIAPERSGVHLVIRYSREMTEHHATRLRRESRDLSEGLSKKNAGTEVTTDIVMLRRLHPAKPHEDRLGARSGTSQITIRKQSPSMSIRRAVPPDARAPSVERRMYRILRMDWLNIPGGVRGRHIHTLGTWHYQLETGKPGVRLPTRPIGARTATRRSNLSRTAQSQDAHRVWTSMKTRSPVINAQRPRQPARNRSASRNGSKEWVWSDDSRRERLCRLYNDTSTTHASAPFNGDHLTLPGASGRSSFIRIKSGSMAHPANAQYAARSTSSVRERRTQLSQQRWN